MPKHIAKYNGIAIGDIVRLTSNNFSKFKRAKVKNIYKESSGVRYVVKVSNGELLDIEEKHIEAPNKACACEIMLLMRLGCQCGGY